MTDVLDLDFTAQPVDPPAGNSDRYGGRWRLVGAGLSNVWRYGRLDLPAVSGRLLLRGPNGTGKTTALEALWPYLLDLDAKRLPAGKARPTTLKLLMSEGAPARGRRYGYAWLTFALPDRDVDPDVLEDGWTGAPGEPDPPGTLVSYGVRFQYAANSTPAVRVTPFTVPGRPGHELPLKTPAGAAMEAEEFRTAVAAAGGTVFDEPEDYVEHLAARIWSATRADLAVLAARLREVRNPTLLGNISPAEAADALRQSLPGADAEVLSATADALAESDQTREAFERDEHAATVLGEFAQVWAAHVSDVARTAHTTALEAATELGVREAKVRTLESAVKRSTDLAEQARTDVFDIERRAHEATSLANAIAQSEAYKAHGRIVDLRQRLTAEQNTAASTLAALRSTAAQARHGTETAVAQLDDQLEELAAVTAGAQAAGADPVALELLLAHTSRPRAVRRVGDETVEAGSGLVVHFDEPAVVDTAGAWRERSEEFRSDADRAQMLRTEHRHVAQAAEQAQAAGKLADETDRRYDEAQQAAAGATRVASTAASTLLTEVRDWAAQHPHLRGLDPAEPDAPDVDTRAGTDPAVDPAAAGAAAQVWTVEDVDELAPAEPALVLESAETWAEAATRAAEAAAAGHEFRARALGQRARDDRAQAAELRTSAAELRAGKLMPLPRPDWAGPGEDEQSLGTLLEWRESAGDDTVRARVELALAAAGILGARLDLDGAATDAWSIRPGAADPLPAGDSLAQLVDVDGTHPAASTARAVLARIRLADTAANASPNATSPAAAVAELTVGRDGTFSTGLLTGRPILALPAGSQVPRASHVGARARLESARARADELDEQATGLEADADAADTDAGLARAAAQQVRADGATFPRRTALRTAEASRAAAVASASSLQGKAEQDRSAAESARAEHARQHSEWVTHARSMALPADDEQLREIVDAGRQRAAELIKAAKRLADTLLPRIRRVVAAVVSEQDLAEELARAEQRAQGDALIAAETTQLLAEAQSVGDADDAVERYESARGEARALEAELGPAREAMLAKQNDASTKAAELQAARERVLDVRPQQVESETRLRQLLTHPPVAASLELADHEAGHGELGTGDELLAAVDELLAGRRTVTRKTLYDRYEAARAEVAQTWTVARDTPVPGLAELETFVLTHSDDSYDPHRGAARAADLATRARAALDRDEARALKEFVVGRLPAAIGTAWAELLAWRKAVNAKMRSAQASSGVGVQVEIELRDDLDSLTRTVFELSCLVGDAARTDEQKDAVGDALSRLLESAVGESMTDRLAAVVDIREWVDVHYRVERPGQAPKRWGSRTGLSGGERRLVVLAPMLAAVAANYDRMGAGGLRLVALDEVPAEVDEAGREGLARFLAELDLDLVCTSYLWDGAPGAWDGIDAHDLEAGPDGTVVSFPMLVRGTDPLPGDTVTLTGATGSSGTTP